VAVRQGACGHRRRTGRRKCPGSPVGAFLRPLWAVEDRSRCDGRVRCGARLAGVLARAAVAAVGRLPRRGCVWQQTSGSGCPGARVRALGPGFAERSEAKRSGSTAEPQGRRPVQIDPRNSTGDVRDWRSGSGERERRRLPGRSWRRAVAFRLREAGELVKLPSWPLRGAVWRDMAGSQASLVGGWSGWRSPASPEGPSGGGSASDLPGSEALPEAQHNRHVCCWLCGTAGWCANRGCRGPPLPMPFLRCAFARPFRRSRLLPGWQGSLQLVPGVRRRGVGTPCGAVAEWGVRGEDSLP